MITCSGSVILDVIWLMKNAGKILLFGFIIGVVAIGGSAAWYLYESRIRIFPETYEPWLNSDPAAYAHVDSVPENDFQLYAYDFSRNKYANAIPNTNRTPNIAATNGHVPSFKIGDDIFIITFKWVSRSSGLAISDSPNFAKNLEALDEYVTVEKLSDKTYAWFLHLNYTRQEAAAR